MRTSPDRWSACFMVKTTTVSAVKEKTTTLF
jgi:hypothetical protein